MTLAISAASSISSAPAKTKAERFWDRLARTWGRPSSEPEPTDTKPVVKTRPYLKAGDTVLDFGMAESMDAAGLVTVEVEELGHNTPEYFVVAKRI